MSPTTTPSVHVHPDPAAACRALAAEIAGLIRSRGDQDAPVVLGLATGGTPIPLYEELRRLHHEEGLSFRNVVTFNLDEYLGLGQDAPQSYWRFMHEQLFDHIDLPPGRIHIPDGLTDDPAAACEAYELAIRNAGGIDLQILGIGTNGHIGFNEPGTARDSRTRVVSLTEKTRSDNAIYFDAPEDVPTRAISMGCATILEARRIALLAFGDRKAAIVKKALHGPVTPEVPASFLQDHPDTAFYLDEKAAAKLG